jgi:NAD(P)-dependent dehydrogenase (short-subunit alcohol dehydrogenase family)
VGGAVEIRDKAVVVTGGASGIGLALVKAFLDNNVSRVAVVDLDSKALDSTRVELSKHRERLVFIETDVTDETAYRSALSEFAADCGGIDVLCSNAGIARSGGVEAPNKDWIDSYEVNVMAHIYGARSVLESMTKKGEGYLINTASAAGLLTNLGAAPYSVSKHAAVGLAEWMAITYGPLGIRVSCLAPQGVNTKMLFPVGETLVDSTVPQRSVLSFGEVLEPDRVAACVIDSMIKEEFLILPHPEVKKYLANKVSDYNRWIKSMSKINQTIAPASQ